MIEALRHFEAEQLRRYPDPFARQFRQAIAEVLSILTAIIPKD